MRVLSLAMNEVANSQCQSQRDTNGEKEFGLIEEKEKAGKKRNNEIEENWPIKWDKMFPQPIPIHSTCVVAAVVVVVKMQFA